MCLVSDTQHWIVSHGTVVRSCIYDGEIVDFNRLSENWMQPDYIPVGWKTPQIAEAPMKNMQKSSVPPVRIVRKISPVGTKMISNQTFVVDFGENGSAVPYLDVSGKKEIL